MELNLLKTWTLRLIKTVWALFASTVILLAVLVSLLKYALPYADNYKQDIESYLKTNFGANVSIGSIGASWQTTGPAIVLYDLKLLANEAAPLDIAIKETRVEVDFWQSLAQQRFVSGAFLLDGVRSTINSSVFFKVRPQSQGSQLFENLSHLFLSQLQSFKVIDSFIKVRHQDGRIQVYQIDALNWLNQGNRHQANGEVFVDGFSNNSISLIVDLYGQRREDIFGQVYLEANQMDVSPWLKQLVGDHITLTSSQANFKVWGDIQNGLVEQAVIDLNDSGIAWQQQQQPQSLAIKSALVYWQKSQEHWQLYTKQAELANEQTQSPFSLQIDANEKTHVAIKDVDIAVIGPILSAMTATKEVSMLAQSDFSGVLSALHMQFDETGNMSTVFDVSGLNYLPVVTDGAYLGLTDLLVSGYWQNNRGWFEVLGEKGAFETQDMFSNPIEYHEFLTQLYVTNSDFGWQVGIPKLQLVNNDVRLSVSGTYSAINSEPHLSLYSEIVGPSQGKITEYLPRYILSDATYDYLAQAIKQGRGELTQLVIDGDPRKMPYSQLSKSDQFGTFKLKSQIKEAEFKFANDWPALAKMDTDLLVDDSLMSIKVNTSEFANLTIKQDVVGHIPLDQNTVSLQLLLSPEQLELTEFHKLVENTPLKQPLGDIFEFVKLQGESSATVNIYIPFSDQPDEYGVVPRTNVQGTVITSNATLALPSINLEFTGVESVVEFNNSEFSISAQQGNLFELPVNFEVSGAPTAASYDIHAQVLGDWQHSQFKELYPNLNMVNYFAGELPVTVDTRVSITEQGFQYFVNGYSDLEFAKYHLSGAVTKELATSGQLKVSLIGDEESSELAVNLNEQLFFDSTIENGIMPQTHLSIGQDDVGLPAQGFDISVAQQTMDFAEVLPFVTDLIADISLAPESSGPSIISSPHAIYGTVQAFDILGQTWTNVSLNAKPEESAWVFSIGAAETLMKVTVPSDLAQNAIDINAEFLKIVAKADDDEQEPIQPEPKLVDSAGLIRGLPDINFVCEICDFNDKPLGKIELQASAVGPELNITKGTMRYKRNSANITGRWVGDSGPGRTYLNGTLQSRYFGDWLLEYGLNTGIKDSDARINLDVNWKSAPYDIEYASMNGSGDFRLGEGSLSEISDQGARIFSLFSLDSLYRKLKFDFSDVFEKGLFYNNIKGDLSLKNGVALSDKIVMDGVSGDMNMTGYTNLTNDALEYNVSFKPKLTSSLGVLSWLAASNPVTIIGAFALDKIIENADVVSEVRLKISGNLAEPKVEEVERFTKRIKVPGNETETEAKPSTDIQPTANPEDNK